MRSPLAMPYARRIEGPKGNAIYQVGGKSFVFFRTPQPDAVDPDTGERLGDVIMIWVESESEKLALVQDPDSPFFTTASIRRPSIGADPGQPVSRYQQNRAGRAHPRWLAVARVEASGGRVDRREPAVAD